MGLTHHGLAWLGLAAALLSFRPPGGAAEPTAEPPFAVAEFRIVEVAENTDPRERWVEYAWEAEVQTRGAGVRRGRLEVVMLDYAGQPVRRDRGPVAAFLGTARSNLSGRFRVGPDEWLRAEDFEAHVVSVPTSLAVSGAVLRRLHVLPGTPMAQGNFAPMRWSAVVSNLGDEAAESSLELHLWGEQGEMLASYPVHRLKLAAGARVRLQTLTVLDGTQFAATRSVTLDAVPLDGGGGG